MKAWVVRFAALYVYNVAVLLVIDLLTPAKVGFHVFWAAVVMVLAELLVKPFVLKMFAKSAAKSAAQRTRVAEGFVQGLIVLAVAAIIWVIVMLLSNVNAGGSWFGAWVLPPFLITIGWWIYSRVNKKFEAQASAIYDRAMGPKPGDAAAKASAATTSVDTAAAHQELHDGLTPEQRKMLDELGKG